MIKLYEFFMHGCWHKWELYQNISLTNEVKNKEIKIGTGHIYKCSKCSRFHYRQIV